ncbi:MAG: ExeA family protein, partial [Candidatus Eiseniibacteriota bacterium]
MFEHHFGLRENPFAAGHHAKFVFPSPEHQEAIAHLRYGIENREPFVLITGEVGTGKTTALFDALAEWQSRVEVALITNSALSQIELLEEIALRFGVPISGQASKPQILAHLERVLAGVYARGDRAILLLDEAQNLERELLEEIRLLSNLERDGTKLVQVFLVGQPELEDKLARAELRQLRQRITVHYRLQPLNAEDTERYIQHRIMVAGGHASTIFPTKACREVFRITHGIPREINTLSSQALLNAFVDDARAVAPAHVTSAAAELEFQSVLDRAEIDLREEQARDVARFAPGRGEASRSAARDAAPREPAAAGSEREPAVGGREDIDIKMIEAWMAELSRSKQGAAAGAPVSSSASAHARAAAKPPVLPPGRPPVTSAAARPEPMPA